MTVATGYPQIQSDPLPTFAILLFPADRELRALRHVEGSPAPLLTRMVPSQGPGSILRTLRYKPERRYVAAVESDDGPRLVIRAYTETDYKWARNAAAAFRSNDG